MQISTERLAREVEERRAGNPKEDPEESIRVVFRSHHIVGAGFKTASDEVKRILLERKLQRETGTVAFNSIDGRETRISLSRLRVINRVIDLAFR